MRIYSIGLVIMTILVTCGVATTDAEALTCSERDSYIIDQGARTVTYTAMGESGENTNRLLTRLHFESFKTISSPGIMHWAACRNPYALDNSHVYYEGLSIPDVRPEFFKSLGMSYFSDDNHIVYGGKILRQADAKSFRRWEGSYYYRDKEHVYHRGRATSADGAELLGNGSGYFKNKETVYFKGAPIDVDPKTFQLVAGHATAGRYTKDKSQVYYLREIVGGADPGSFRWLRSIYYQDDASIYVDGEALAGVKSSRFQGFDCNWGKDDRWVYNEMHRIEHLDAATFEVLIPCDYTKDNLAAYYRGTPIEDADPASFEVMRKHTNFSRDRVSFFERGRLVPGVDPTTVRFFHRLKCETDDFLALDSVNVYRRDFSIAIGVSPDSFGERCLLPN